MEESKIDQKSQNPTLLNDISDAEKSRLCRLCGSKCCKMVYLPLNIVGSEELAFYRLRGFEFITIGDRLFTVIHKACQKFKNNSCSIYPLRPQACKVYDGREDELLKEVCLWPKKQV